jgi:TolA-binding protein
VSRESEDSLSELARDLLAAERSASEPEALKERAFTRAQRVLEADRPSRFELREALSSARAHKRVFRLRAALALAATLALAGIAAASGAWLQASKPAVPSPPVARVSPSVRFSPSSAARLSPKTDGRATAVDPPAAAAPAQVSSVAGRAAAEARRPTSLRQYAVELQLLEPARSGIARGDYAGALEAIARHQREFPGGLLAEERSALRVKALWGTGRFAEAEAAATAFRRRYPRSALLAWMGQRPTR